MANEMMIRAGAAAKYLRESPEFKMFLEATRVDAFQGWAATQPEQKAEREEFYYLLMAIEKLNAKLTSTEQVGRQEEIKLAQEEAKAKADAAHKQGE